MWVIIFFRRLLSTFQPAGWYVAKFPITSRPTQPPTLGGMGNEYRPKYSPIYFTLLHVAQCTVILICQPQSLPAVTGTNYTAW